jgi:hypothetical protein
MWLQIKDLIVGAELAGLSKERDDYLNKLAQSSSRCRRTGWSRRCARCGRGTE